MKTGVSTRIGEGEARLRGLRVELWVHFLAAMGFGPGPGVGAAGRVLWEPPRPALHWFPAGTDLQGPYWRQTGLGGGGRQ